MDKWLIKKCISPHGPFVNDVWKLLGVITCYFSNQSIKSDWIHLWLHRDLSLCIIIIIINIIIGLMVKVLKNHVPVLFYFFLWQLDNGLLCTFLERNKNTHLLRGGVGTACSLGLMRNMQTRTVVVHRMWEPWNRADSFYKSKFYQVYVWVVRAGWSAFYLHAF